MVNFVVICSLVLIGVGVMTVVVLCVWLFFFKQKTAYEMRISDWSSDVCSSDLPRLGDDLHMLAKDAGFLVQFAQGGGLHVFAVVYAPLRHLPGLHRIVDPLADENLALHVDEHDAHAWPVGEF